MGWPRTIAHADMDAFFAAVEVLDDPRLAGKPLLVGHPGARGVVATASYEARPFGVGSAMSMARARRLCPQAIVVPPRFERYAEISHRVMEALARFTPLVEPLSLDEAFCDLTGTEGLHGPPAEAGRRIKAAIREATGGLTASVGVAPTKYVAKVASDLRKPDGLVVVAPDEVRAFLDPLPVRRLWGVGPTGEAALARLGLATIGEVARADPAFLASRLGALGPHVTALARGEDPRAVVPDRDARTVGSEATLEADVLGAAAIRPHLRDAADTIGRRLRGEGLLAGGCRVKLKTRRFALHTRQTMLDAPTDAAAALFAAAEALLPGFDLAEPVRLVGMAAFALRPASAPVQGTLFATDADARARRLERALDTARAKFGRGAVRRATDVGPV